MFKSVGSFEVNSGKIIISDPGYHIEKIFEAMNGEWQADICTAKGCFGENVAGVNLYNKEYGSMCPEFLGTFGVDSGQLGVYDSEEFKEDDDEWYEKNSELSCSQEMCGLLKGGFVSSSGYGNGDYKVYCKRDFGLIVALEIVFIEEDEQDCGW